MTPRIEIATGSDSDLIALTPAFDCLDTLGIPHQERIRSAHRTVKLSAEYATNLEKDGFSVSIDAAGLAAHLGGVTAGHTIIPVVGLPMNTPHLNGLDSLLSTLQMPDDIPVGSVGVEQSKMAALFAAQICAMGSPELTGRIREYRKLPVLSHELKPIKPYVVILASELGTPDREKYANLYASLSTQRAKVLEGTVSTLNRLGIKHEFYELAGPDEPDEPRVKNFVEQLGRRGTALILAFAEQLDSDYPMSIAQYTHIPVIGLPVLCPTITKGEDEIQYIFRMIGRKESPCEPIASVGINRGKNAALYAGQILGVHLPELREMSRAYRTGVTASAESKNTRLQEIGTREYIEEMKKK